MERSCVVFDNSCIVFKNTTTQANTLTCIVNLGAKLTDFWSGSHSKELFPICVVYFHFCQDTHRVRFQPPSGNACEQRASVAVKEAGCAKAVTGSFVRTCQHLCRGLFLSAVSATLQGSRLAHILYLLKWSFSVFFVIKSLRF